MQRFKTPTVDNIAELARRGVFTPDECRSLMKAAFDLAAGLKKMDVTPDDIVLFPGTSPSWIYVAFKLLRLDRSYRAHRFAFSGSKFRKAAYEDKEVTYNKIKEGWYETVGKGLFPSGQYPNRPKGRIFIVDFVNSGQTFEFLKRLFSDLWPTTSGKMRLVQLRAKEYTRMPNIAFDVIVNDAPDNLTPQNSFMLKLDNANPYPRGCPVLGPHNLGRNMKLYWKIVLDSRHYQEWLQQLDLAVKASRTSATRNSRDIITRHRQQQQQSVIPASVLPRPVTGLTPNPNLSADGSRAATSIAKSVKSSGSSKLSGRPAEKGTKRKLLTSFLPFGSSR